MDYKETTRSTVKTQRKAPSKTLPIEYQSLLRSLQEQISTRLVEFSQVPAEQYFYEMCYCICTVQSNAANAQIVQLALMDMDFEKNGGDVVSLLCTPRNYIRFHNVKSAHLTQLRLMWPEIHGRITWEESVHDKRVYLVNNVRGIGFKEASHFLRNIGFRGLAILDRHILACLRELACSDVPNQLSRNTYLATEAIYLQYARAIGIDSDVLDLLFWAKRTGEVRK